MMVACLNAWMHGVRAGEVQLWPRVLDGVPQSCGMSFVPPESNELLQHMPAEFTGKVGSTLHLFTTADPFTTFTAHNNPDGTYSGTFSLATGAGGITHADQSLGVVNMWSSPIKHTQGPPPPGTHAGTASATTR